MSNQKADQTTTKAPNTEPKPVFSDDYQQNITFFDKLFGIGINYDFVSREQLFAGHSAHYYFVDSFVDSSVLERLFLYFTNLTDLQNAEDIEAFAAAHMPYTEVTVVRDADQFAKQILSGTMGMLFDTFGAAGLIVDVRRYPSRGIEQAESDRVLRGAHDSFIETVKSNTTLIRRRIRDPKLTFEVITVGEATQSDVVIAYVRDRADKGYVDKLRGMIQAIKVDALSMGQQSLAECLITRRWYNPFPKFRFTERPDTAAAHLLEGSVIILCDTSPNAMILPTCILDFMQVTDDYYFPPLVGTYLRLLRYVVFLLTLLLTPTWYLMITNTQWVPDWLNFILVDTQSNLPIIIQLFVVEFAIDGLKLASMNTPSALNNTFGVVGGLILGDFAVGIGWFIPEVVVYMGFVAVANFAQSSYELGYTFKLMRMLLLLTTGLLGLIGYIGGLVLIVVLVATNNTVGGKRNYLYPLIPFNWKALKRLIIREKLK